LPSERAADPLLAMPTSCWSPVWKSFGFYMVIFLAGLQRHPGHLYEGGRAGWRQRLEEVPTSLSDAEQHAGLRRDRRADRCFQAFDQIYVLTGGGPYRSTETIVMQVYQSGFKGPGTWIRLGSQLRA